MLFLSIFKRRNLKLKLKKEQQDHQNNLDNHTNTLNKFHTIISNMTSQSPTITATTALSGPVMNGFMPDLQLNNSNTSSTSSYEYYMNTGFKSKNPQQQQRQLHDYQKQKLINNGYKFSSENDTLISKLDYYTLRKHKIIVDDDTNTNLKVRFFFFRNSFFFRGRG
jgi:hypothetical protein